MFLDRCGRDSSTILQTIETAKLLTFRFSAILLVLGFDKRTESLNNET